MKRVLFLILGICFLVTFNCQRDEEEDPIDVTIRIGEEASVIVDAKIDEAYSSDKLVDPEEIALEIRSIKNVKSAIVNETGTGIIIEQRDGMRSNIYIVREDDERMFKTNSKNIFNKGDKGYENYSVIKYYPNGNKKALILSPFQSSINTDISQISQYLELAGYTVESYLNSEATLERFRGSFLNDFDVVIIRTHGNAHFETTNGTKTTILTTGEIINKETYWNRLTDEERPFISSDCPFDGRSYFGIGVTWLNITTDEKFKNSWIYAGACESSYWDSGNMSFSEAFLKQGAGGYNGFDNDIYTPLSNLIVIKMSNMFSSGLSFHDASNEVRSEQLLSWITRLTYAETRDVRNFDDHQISTEPFYLFDKGSAPNTPSSPNPPNNGSGVSTSPTLTWTCSDPDAGDLLTYDVFFGTTSNPTQQIGTDLTTASISRSGLSQGTTYYWKVVAKDNHNNSTTGPIWSFTTVSNSGTIPTNGIVAYYPFNGNANDLSGNNNNGTVNGAMITTDRKGNSNSAYQFDGDNDYIEINHSTSLNLSQAISVSFWAKFDSEAGFYYPSVIIDKYGCWGITTRNSEVSWTVTTSNGEYSFWTFDFDLNRYYHFVMVYSGSGSSAYVDGTLQHSMTGSGSLIQTTNNIFIGRHQLHNDGYHFDGALDDVRIYNRALTQQEINALYNE